MKPHSIARRVVAFVLLVEVCSGIALVGFAFFYERHVHFQALDVALRGHADQLLGAVTDAEDSSDSILLDTSELHFPPGDLYSVREDNGRLLGTSPGWNPPAELVSRPLIGATTLIGGREYRVVRVAGVRVVDPGTAGVRHQITVFYASPTAVAWAPVLLAVRSFAGACLLLILCSGLAVTVVVRRSMEPLQQLAGAAGTISAQSWNFTPPPVARTATELAPLVSALEKLVARLRVSFAQQRRFVSDSAHELKTAVTVVKSSLQLLTLRERSPREYQAGLEVCLTDCARMEELVYRMLTLARLDEDSASRAEDRHEPARAARAWPATNLTTDLGTDLGAGAREAVASLESLARLRSIQLRCAVPAGLPGGLMSAIPPEDWQTLLSNLVVNAIQHSAPGGAVDIELAAEHDGEPGGELAGQPGRALCVVSDRGEGIAPEALPHVFDRFFRGDASRARSGGEAGLGLAIAKAIVDRAQGSISIDSTLGAGTRVRLSLPLIAAPRRQGLTSSAEIHR